MAAFVASLSKLLSAHGGWGLAAVTAYVCRWLYFKRDEDRKQFVLLLNNIHKEHAEEREARHKEFTTMLKETQDLLSSVAVLIRKCQGPNHDE